MPISRQLTEVVSVLVKKILTLKKKKRKAEEKKVSFDLKAVKRSLGLLAEIS